MPGSPYERRLATLARERSAALAVAPLPGICAARPLPGHAARVRRALAVAVAAGIPADDAYPVLLRALAGMGILLRPVHFMPLWVPLGLGALVGLGVFGMAVAAVELLAGLFAAPNLAAEAGSVSMAACSLASGLAFAVMIRRQARRAQLPPWAEI